jgi:hypothetical protein
MSKEITNTEIQLTKGKQRRLLRNSKRKAERLETRREQARLMIGNWPADVGDTPGDEGPPPNGVILQ